MELTKILALVRRYTVAIAEGRLEAKKIAAMTDEELAAFDAELTEELSAEQKRAEDLANGENK